MRHLILFLAATLLAGHELATDYAREGRLRIESEASLTLETTHFEMLVDGEPLERPFGGGGLAVEEKRHVVLFDEVLEHEEGRPTKVRRTFETIEAELRVSAGEEDSESSSQGPLAGVVLELALDTEGDEDGEVTVELVEGDEPDDDQLLEGHVLELCLDALLPAGEVDLDERWDLDDEAIEQALSLALGTQLFPRPERQAIEAGAGRGEGGGRGRGRARGGSPARFLADAEWEGQATLEAAEEDHEGESCSVILLELEASGELPEPGGFGGGRRRERALEPGLSGSLPPLTSLQGMNQESSFEVELEGRLLFSNTARRPLRVELKGTLSTERSAEFDRQGRSMTMNTEQQGSFEYTLSLSED